MEEEERERGMEGAGGRVLYTTGWPPPIPGQKLLADACLCLVRQRLQPLLSNRLCLAGSLPPPASTHCHVPNNNNNNNTIQYNIV